MTDADLARLEELVASRPFFFHSCGKLHGDLHPPPSSGPFPCVGCTDEAVFRAVPALVAEIHLHREHRRLCLAATPAGDDELRRLCEERDHYRKLALGAESQNHPVAVIDGNLSGGEGKP